MIAGSPYYRLIATNDQPLSPEQNAEEQSNMERETARREAESPHAREARIAKYERERRQDNALLLEMVAAFDFRLTGEETISGHRCFVLSATPRAGYEPKSHETKVLTGMRGTMWIDEQAYQWVQVHAEVIKPVTFGLFIAHVHPGTQFTLEQRPVAGNIWLPSHFSQTVKASILFASHDSSDDETYSNYRLR